MSSYLYLNAIWAETRRLSQGCSSAVSESSWKLSSKKLRYQSFMCANLPEEQAKVSWQQEFLSLLVWMCSWLCSLSPLSMCTGGHGWGAATGRDVQSRSFVLLTNTQTLNLLPSFADVHPLHFPATRMRFPCLSNIQAVADPWSLIKIYIMLQNNQLCRELLIKDTFENVQLLSNVADACSRETACCGWTSFTDFGCTVWNTCVSAGSCWLTVPTLLLVKRTSKMLPVVFQENHMGSCKLLGFSETPLSVLKGIQGLSCDAFGWQSCGYVAESTNRLRGEAPYSTRQTNINCRRISYFWTV